MGATNLTTHYELSQFVSTDKPAWLQDYNGDMAKIDAAIDEAKVTADTAQLTATSASGAAAQNANDITALQTSVNGQGSNITALQLAVNTINSLIGNGTPTTTDQTLIGAINEINAKVTDLSGLKVWTHIYDASAASSIAPNASAPFDNIPSGVVTPLGAIVSVDGYNLCFAFFYSGQIYVMNPTDTTQNIGVGSKCRVILFYKD